MRHTVLLLASVLLGVPASLAFAATVYVGPNETYRTIQAGYDAVPNPPTEPYTIIVRDGVYTDVSAVQSWHVGVVLSHGGTATNPITVKAEHSWREVGDGNGAVLDGRKLNGVAGIEFHPGVSYVTIQDLEFRNYGNVDDEVEDWSEAIHSYVSGTQTASSHNTFKGNHIHDCSLGILDEGGNSPHCTMDGNVFHHIGGHYRFHAFYWNSDDALITNNVIYDILDGEALDISGYFTANNVVISNNTFGPGIEGWPIVLYGGSREEHAVSNLTIQNNIFYRPGKPAISWCISTSDVTNAVVRNNLTYGCELNDPHWGAAVCKCGETPGPRYVFDLSETTVAFSNNPTGDPLFVNPSGPSPDFHLRTGSPALHAGATALAPDHDLDGEARPRKGKCDIGAYQGATKRAGRSSRQPGEKTK